MLSKLLGGASNIAQHMQSQGAPSGGLGDLLRQYMILNQIFGHQGPDQPMNMRPGAPQSAPQPIASTLGSQPAQSPAPPIGLSSNRPRGILDPGSFSPTHFPMTPSRPGGILGGLPVASVDQRQGAPPNSRSRMSVSARDEEDDKEGLDWPEGNPYMDEEMVREPPEYDRMPRREYEQNPDDFDIPQDDLVTDDPRYRENQALIEKIQRGERLTSDEMTQWRNLRRYGAYGDDEWWDSINRDYNESLGAYDRQREA